MTDAHPEPKPQKQGKNPGDKIVIKKYANRRLYNTGSSSYVTLEHLREMVKEGVDFVVYDAKTGEDITRSVLGQIIFEEESKGEQNLLPIQFLRQLIGFYGGQMQSFIDGIHGKPMLTASGAEGRASMAACLALLASARDRQFVPVSAPK